MNIALESPQQADVRALISELDAYSDQLKITPPESRHRADLSLLAQPHVLFRTYRANGFRERGPFGAYRAEPLSVFMEKEIAG